MVRAASVTASIAPLLRTPVSGRSGADPPTRRRLRRPEHHVDIEEIGQYTIPPKSHQALQGLVRRQILDRPAIHLGSGSLAATSHLERMSLQDLGNLGDFVSGVGTIILTGAALWGGGAALQDVRARLRQQRELAAEQREQIRLDRRRVLNGWSRGGTHVHRVQPAILPRLHRRVNTRH